MSKIDPYYPRIGVVPGKPFLAQFQHVYWNYLSFAVTPIEALARDGSGAVISRGTGFFWLQSNRCYLITALHVFSARNTFTGEPLSTSAFVPKRIRIFPMFQKRTAVPQSARQTIEIDITDEDDKPRWKIDPFFDDFRTDIAAIDVTAHLNQPLSELVVVNPQSDDLIAFIGQSISVVGYPTRHYHDPYPAIWRTGTFASEPGLFIDGRPMFLIDASTSDGMSGAPVMQVHVGPAPVSDGQGGTKVEGSSVLTMRFIGVYAGRFAHKHPAGELGYAFYANRVPLVVDS